MPAASTSATAWELCVRCLEDWLFGCTHAGQASMPHHILYTHTHTHTHKPFFPHLSLFTYGQQEGLNAFMALGQPAWKEARATLQRLLSAGEGVLRDDAALREAALLPMVRARGGVAVLLRRLAVFGQVPELTALRGSGWWKKGRGPALTSGAAAGGASA